MGARQREIVTHTYTHTKQIEQILTKTFGSLAANSSKSQANQTSGALGVTGPVRTTSHRWCEWGSKLPMSSEAASSSREGRNQDLVQMLRVVWKRVKYRRLIT